MLKLTTPVDVGTSRARISFSKPTAILGSCFADNMGQRMSLCGFPVSVNPLGTTYNPISIAQSLRRIASGHPFEAEECVKIGAGDGRICSFAHHTRHARPTTEEFLANANDCLQEAHDFWLRTKLLIVTLGTAWCFRHNASGQVVTNCLKRPAAEFTRFRLSTTQCAEALTDIMTVADGRDVIFTVSPIRHLADGAHGNAISKATLMMAVEAMVESRHETAEYFPSYEILTDELRDYRFYADDMTHPSALAESYIFDRFMDYALPDVERPQLQEGIRRAKRMAHRDMGEQA